MILQHMVFASNLFLIIISKKGVKGKGKGKVRNTAIPPNQLKRYIARSQNIPAKSDDEYASESDGDDGQGPPIGTNSPVSSDADTILYAGSEDDKGIPGCSSGVPIPGHTSGCDETIEIELKFLGIQVVVTVMIQLK